MQIQEKRRQEKKQLRKDVVENRTKGGALKGFYTSSHASRVHRDKRTFGEFPGAGCVRPGEAWEEGLREVQGGGGRAAGGVLKERNGTGGEGGGGGGRGRSNTTDSICSAIVEVQKVKERTHAPGIVRVTIR